MLNEEGGIDPLEFRFHAMTDRVGTTGTVWLGLTLGCAQCHTHKFDPLLQREYYQVMAFLNNADEPEMDVPRPDLAARRAEVARQAAARVDDLADGFPAGNAIDGNPKTGWAIHVPGTWNVNRTATFTLEKPAGFPGGTRWTIQLGQQHGTHHTLGRVRLGFGQQSGDDRPVEVRRRDHLERKFNEWLKQEESKAVRW